MDLYLVSRDRRRPAPLGMAVVAVIGMIIWAFTAQGRAAAFSAEGPTETAAKPNSVQTHAIDDNDLDDDFDANGGGERDSSGGDDSSGDGASRDNKDGDRNSSGGDDSRGDGASVGDDTRDHDSSGGDDSSGDGVSTGEDTTPDGGTPPPGNNPPPPAGNNPPPAANNPPPSQGTLGSSSAPPVVMLPDTAVAAADGTGTLVAGLAALALAGAVAVRRIARPSSNDR